MCALHARARRLRAALHGDVAQLAGDAATAGDKRKRSGLLSPDEAAALVSSSTASYLFVRHAC